MVQEKLHTIHREPTGQVELAGFSDRYFTVMEKEFGERFVTYRRDWSAASEFKSLPDHPLSLDLEVNTGCNLACVMCVLGGKKHQRDPAKRMLMPDSLYARLMDESQGRLPAMTFGYLSEPMLHPHLPKLILMARKAGVMDIRLGVNGTLLKEDDSRRLIDAGLTRLEISLDALSPQTYRNIRKGGNLTKVELNIIKFLKIREKCGSDFPILRLSFLKLPQNQYELEPWLAFWKDRADLFSIQEPIYFEDAPISQDADLVEPENPGNFHCAQPWQRLIVRADGSVFPCCSIYGLNMPIGSASDHGIQAIWDGEYMNKLRTLHQAGGFQREPACLQCARRSRLKRRELYEGGGSAK